LRWASERPASDRRPLLFDISLRMLVQFRSAPRNEPYGRVAVFEDLEGNRWDLLGP